MTPVLCITIVSAEAEHLIRRFRQERLETTTHDTIDAYAHADRAVFEMPPESMTDEVSNKLGMIAKMFEGKITMQTETKD